MCLCCVLSWLGVVARAALQAPYVNWSEKVMSAAHEFPELCDHSMLAVLMTMIVVSLHLRLCMHVCVDRCMLLWDGCIYI